MCDFILFYLFILMRNLFIFLKNRPWKIKIVMACLRPILRDESQNVSNSPLRSSSPTLNPPTNPAQSLKIYHDMRL